MNVLWFEVSTPCRYENSGVVTGGWQDSLERIIRSCDNIKLTIAFDSKKKCKKKTDGSVTYIPINLNFSFWDKVKNFISWEVYAQKLEQEMAKIVTEVRPDIIHVFGAEWPFGRIAKFTDVPVVIHIMGSLVPYTNALYAPGFSFKDVWQEIPLWRLKKKIGRWLAEKKYYTWLQSELQVWLLVKYYMGRTEWDRALSNVMHPGRKYFHVDEALRPSFVSFRNQWCAPKRTHHILLSTGCSTFWKGPDMLLKTAQILKTMGLDFEWHIAGKIDDPYVGKAIERKLKTTFLENNVVFLGFVQPDQLSKELCDCSLYVHTAYIENSPNAICEAQCLGVPVVSTNVGGISSLVRNGVDGDLVPANDPWQMANAIVELLSDDSRLQTYSKNGREFALARHDDDRIKKDLLNCYNDIIEKTN